VSHGVCFTLPASLLAFPWFKIFELRIAQGVHAGKQALVVLVEDLTRCLSKSQFYFILNCQLLCLLPRL